MELKKLVTFGLTAIFVGTTVSSVVSEGPKKTFVDNPKKTGKKLMSGLRRLIGSKSGAGDEIIDAPVENCGVTEAASAAVEEATSQSVNSFHGRNGYVNGGGSGRENRFQNGNKFNN